MGAVTLRPYQEDALDRLRANIRNGVRNQCLCVPTGGGKTLISTYMIREAVARGRRCIFVVDRTVLCEQASSVFDQFGIDHGIIMSDHWRRRPDLPVQIASAQTLARRRWPPAHLIIVDECHTQQQTVLRRIAQRDAVVIGLSATPTTRGLGKHYDAVVNVTTTNKLIADGHLTPYRIYAASEPDMEGVRVVAGEWEEEETTRRVLPIVGDCVREYLDKANGTKAIAFGVNTAHCAALRAQFMAAGVQCELYTYKEGAEQRRVIMDEFRKPDSYIRVLVSVSALSRGLDVPDVGCVILARPLRTSIAELVQSMGRGLRPAPGKDHCIILDHGGSTDRMWGQLRDIYEYGISELDDGRPKPKAQKKPRERGPMKCPKCAHLHAPRPMCPACGHQYPKRSSSVEHKAGSLRELAGGEVTGEDRRRVWAMLLHIANGRGYATGWAAHKYRERFGAFPRGIHPEPEPPTPELQNWVRSRAIAWAKAQKKQRKAS